MIAERIPQDSVMYMYNNTMYIYMHARVSKLSVPSKNLMNPMKKFKESRGNCILWGIQSSTAHVRAVCPIPNVLPCMVQCTSKSHIHTCTLVQAVHSIPNVLWQLKYSIGLSKVHVHMHAHVSKLSIPSQMYCGTSTGFCMVHMSKLSVPSQMYYGNSKNSTGFIRCVQAIQPTPSMLRYLNNPIGLCNVHMHIVHVSSCLSHPKCAY